MTGCVKSPLVVRRSVAFIDHNFSFNQLFLITGVILNELHKGQKMTIMKNVKYLLHNAHPC